MFSVTSSLLFVTNLTLLNHSKKKVIHNYEIENARKGAKGKKRNVYVMLKIIKKCTDAKVTSFKVKNRKVDIFSD